MKKLMMAVAAIACAFAAVASDGNSRGCGESPRGRGENTRVWLPLGLSILTPPIQLPSPSHTVFGGMINLGYGQVENLAVADLGVINNVTDTMTGLELGAVNIAGTCVGAQVGPVNVASRTVGVQLGVLNFSGSGGAIVFPILNIGF